MAAHVRHQHAVTLADKRRHHAVPRTDVVGESVKEDDRKTLRTAALLEADGQNWSLDGADGRRRGGLPAHERRGDRELQEVAAALIHQRLEALCCCSLLPGAGGIGRDDTYAVM